MVSLSSDDRTDITKENCLPFYYSLSVNSSYAETCQRVTARSYLSVIFVRRENVTPKNVIQKAFWLSSFDFHSNFS